jgi:predicted component of type VI protein secretion system
MDASQCPNCDAPVLAGAIFCDNCGYDLRMPTARRPADGGAAAAAGSQVCAACQHANPAGARFCEHCGSQLGVTPPAVTPPAGPPGAVPPPAEEQSMLPEAQLPGMQPEAQPAARGAARAEPPPTQATQPPSTAHLVVKDLAGIPAEASLALPAGTAEWIIGREDAASQIFPEINLDPYGAQEAGVSRRHARLSAQAGGFFIEDLNTVNGTFLNRQKLNPGQPAALKDGDELRLGKLRLVFSSR